MFYGLSIKKKKSKNLLPFLHPYTHIHNPHTLKTQIYAANVIHHTYNIIHIRKKKTKVMLIKYAVDYIYVALNSEIILA